MTNDEFKGTFPYSSELFGVFQPILGWKANTGKLKVVKETEKRIKTLVEGMLDDNILRDPLKMNNFRILSPDAPIKLRTPSWIETPLRKYSKEKINKTLGNDDKLSKEQWETVFETENLEKDLGWLNTKTTVEDNANQKTTVNPMISKPSDNPKNRQIILNRRGLNKNVGNHIGTTQTNLHTSKIAIQAGILNWLSKENPQILHNMFLANEKKWEIQKNFIDPLADFDPQTQQTFLSPIGMIDLFREYFFELETFLGSPVGHVWISPGGTVELIEVNTRKKTVESSIEVDSQTTSKSESDSTEQDEISDAVKEENASNIKFGFSAEGGAQIGVYHAQASANMGYDNAHKLNQETSHKHMRQQSEKLSSEIRKNYKTTFRTATVTEDTSSRRYVVQNTTDKLVNYELRRKMRKVGIQVQHIGTQLCWQVYVDDPGKTLGLAELVHIAKPSDGNVPPPPDAPKPLPYKEVDYSVNFPYEADGTDEDKDERYVNGKNVETDEKDKIIYIRYYEVMPPEAGYTLKSINELSIEKVNPEEDYPEVAAKYDVDSQNNKFSITLDDVNFNDQPEIKFNLKLIWKPPDQTQEMLSYQKDLAKYSEKNSRLSYIEYLKSVRERVKLARNVNKRYSLELREEERSKIYEHLLSQLTNFNTDQSQHVISEMIRALFDVDKMLYFVAPEWWMARKHYKQELGDTTQLIDDDVISWGGIKDQGRDNYLITDDSEPAPKGSSLGWLIQLDGDAHRNAFLNSPWVKAVIPIRPGREIGAINWLKLAHVEGTDGLDAEYDGPEEELHGKTVQEVLNILAEKVSEMNEDIKNTLATETVYETGFDPLEGGFRATGIPYTIFDQWIEVLPTDQVVALEYDASEHI